MFFLFVLLMIEAAVTVDVILNRNWEEVNSTLFLSSESMKLERN